MFVTPLQWTKIGLQCRTRIYVALDYPCIIRFLKPLSDDVFKACFEDCHFDENISLSLGENKLMREV